MTLTSMMDILRSWQTLLGALLGFGGVIVTLILNEALKRKATRDTRNQEAESLCVALRAELLELRKALRQQKDELDRGMKGKKLKEQDLIIIPLCFRQIFDASIDRLGLLRPDQVIDVLQAYNQQQSLAVLLADWATNYRKDLCVIEATHTTVIADWYETVDGFASSAIASLGGGTTLKPLDDGDALILHPRPKFVMKAQQ